MRRLLAGPVFYSGQQKTGNQGEEGEIHLRGPLVMREYWEDPEATDAAIKPGRWLDTGDVGQVQDGKLYIASRKRDLILRAGENVYPFEIERRLEVHPAIAEAAVISACCFACISC